MTALARRIALVVRSAVVAGAIVLAGCASLGPRPLPPKVYVDSVQTVVGSNGDTRFRVRLDVNNPNAYDVAVSAIEATVRIEDQAIATANLPQPVVLKASAESKLDIEARPDFNALAKAFDRMLRRLAIAYEVTGFAVIDARQSGDMRIPFGKRGELPLSDFLGRLR